MFTKIAIAAGLLAALFLYMTMGKVSSSEAHRMVKDGAILLDVRSPAEFADGHIDGAINIPVQQLRDRVDELPGRDQAVVVYCRSGGRSRSAKSILEGAGFTAVADLGAMARW